MAAPPADQRRINADYYWTLGIAAPGLIQHGAPARGRRTCSRRLADEIGSIRDFPLYDGDLEATQGIPAPVHRLKERIAAAAGLLLVTPEYNNSVPGVFKNAIDWLSRPEANVPRALVGKPVALMGATGGPGATILAQAAWLPVLRSVGAQTWAGPRIYVPNAANVFDAEGRLTDESVRASVAKFLVGFSEFIAHATGPA